MAIIEKVLLNEAKNMGILSLAFMYCYVAQGLISFWKSIVVPKLETLRIIDPLIEQANVKATTSFPSLRTLIWL